MNLHSKDRKRKQKRQEESFFSPHSPRFAHYNHLDERSFKNVFEQLKKDENYQEASKAEDKVSKKCKNLGLTEEQQKTVEEWIESIYAENAAYSMVIFRMRMQCCFSLIILADLK